MKQFFSKYKLHIIFTILGGVSSYLYRSYAGCSSGTCLITSVWYGNMIYGMVLGYLIGGMIHDNLKKKHESNTETKS